MKKRIPPFVSLILFEDDDYIVVNKPAFLSSLEDRHDTFNLFRMARSYHPEAQLCHRLDKETSGVLIIAKNPTSYRSMAIHFEKRRVTKVYHAVVDGLHDLKDQIVEAPISIVQGSYARIDYNKGKIAKTTFKSLKAYRKHTLVECRPITGRMHQIRVHLSFLNAPITGDLTYKGTPLFLSSIKKNYHIGKYKEEKPLISRLALHAQMVSFPLMNNSNTLIEAPYPKDFEVLLKQLEKNI